MNWVRSTTLILIAPAAVAMATWAPVGWAASLPSPTAPDSFAVRAGRILPVSPDLPKVINHGVIIVRDGRIAAIGADVEVPPGLPVVEFPDGTLMPGLVAAATDLAGSHRGDQSVAGGYRAVDAFDRYGDYQKLLAAGVTTAHVSPGSHRLLTGQGAVVKLGGPPAERILNPQADLCINLGPEVFDPPQDVTYPFPASADVEIVPGRRQRPASRMGQLLALEESIRDSLAGKQYQGYSLHPLALAQAWQQKQPLRIRAAESPGGCAADLRAALKFLQEHRRKGYVVGGAGADRVATELQAAHVPLVYRPPSRFRSPGSNIGRNPDAPAPSLCDFQKLSGVTLALAPPSAAATEDLRLAAIRCNGAGLDRQRTLEAITSVPAEVLGVGDRVGRLAPGMDADFLVLSSDPLEVSTHVQRVYIEGRCVFEPPRSAVSGLDASPSGPLVIRAGTIWAGPGKEIHDGEVLIEQGKIVDVGRSVPHPPFARVIDAGPEGFVTPGFIDAHSHLGLHGDRASVGNDVRLSKLIGVADVTDLRVCRAGITTVIMSPYLAGRLVPVRTARIIGGRIVFTTRSRTASSGSSAMGSPAVAVKTFGHRRADRVIRDPAIVLFDVSRADPTTVQETLAKPLAAGKKYLDSWVKYEKDLKEFLEKKKKGEKVETDKKAEQEETDEPAKPDPITGTWQATITGPVPAPITATIVVRLDGTSVEGRITRSSMGVTGRVSGTFIDKHLSATIEVDVPGVDTPPKLEADLVEEDHLKGTMEVAEVTAQFEAKRTDTSPTELKVVRTRRTRGKDGRPLPPKRNESLEPLKSLLEKKIPAVVKVSTPAQIREVLALLVDKHGLPLVLLGAEGAAVHAEKLAEKKVTVVVPPAVLRTKQYRDYHQADELARRGVPIAFQTDAEDAARDLPAVVMYAVERGLDAEDALTALTAGAAKAMKIDDRVGTLEPGKDGDLVIFSSHPFQGPSRVLRVIVGGEVVVDGEFVLGGEEIRP